MLIEKFFRGKKTRKYPIKRDARGKSARRQCFELFADYTAEDIVLEDIAKTAGVTIETVATYYRQWKKEPTLEKQLAFAKQLFDKNAPDRDKNLELFAKLLRIPREQLETILHQPHGLRRIMTRKFYFPLQAADDHRRYVILELAMWLTNYIYKHGGNLEDVKYAFEHWMGENRQYREKEDEDTADDNRDLKIMRRILEVSAEQERQGRVQPDKLTPEERDSILKDGVNAYWRRIEMTYWETIAELCSKGLTIEEARKAYRDFIDESDGEKAKELRAYQDKIHPLKPDKPPLPKAPEPPPAP
jgi:CRP-like cAMP-binding protein